jgi:glycosyltransferase involved in cell wall biosynthesis
MDAPSSDGLARPPVVSVIMNCFNSARYLREAIDSVYAQTFENWEIVFWDNGSTDESAEIAQSYTDGRLRYFRGATTVPLGHARNLAIAQSKGSLIAFLDCDDIWLPNKLEKQLPLFEADVAVGIVYSDSLYFNGAGHELRLYATKTPYRGHCFPELLNNYLVSLETAVLRRAALDQLDHWFDLSFSAIEEYDLFVRVGLQWKVDFVPEVLAKWRVHGESLTWRAPDRFTQEKRIMLEQLQENPRVQSQHAAAMAAAWRGLAVADATSLWRKGDGRAARRSLGAIASRQAGLLWLATFFPPALVESMRAALRPTVSPKSK